MTLIFTPVTLKFKSDPDTVYLHAGNQVAKLRHWRLLTVDEINMENENIG